MKEPLKVKVRSRTKPRGTCVPLRTKASPGKAKVAPRIPDGTGDTHNDILRLRSLSIDDVLRGVVPIAPPPVLRLVECEATPVTATADRLDVACDYMPDWIEYLHLPPCDPPDDFRRMHLCVLLGADDEIVGSAYGSTWVKARIEACALYRRSLIRCVSVRKLD